MTIKCKAEDCNQKFNPRTTWQDYCSRKCQQRIWKRYQARINKIAKSMKKRDV